MTSQKGAEADTKKNIILARKGVEEEVLSMQGATESPQKHQKSPQGGPKSTQNELKMVPKRFQDNLLLENVELVKTIDFQMKNVGF